MAERTDMPSGRKPKRGEAAKNRTIRVPDHLWERFRAAAPDGNVGDWMIRAGEARLADPDGASTVFVTGVDASGVATGWVVDRRDAHWYELWVARRPYLLHALCAAVNRPVRWAHPRTVEIFNTDADEHRPLLRSLRSLRRKIDDAANGVVAIVFHTRRESARLYAAFLAEDAARRRGATEGGGDRSIAPSRKTKSKRY